MATFAPAQSLSSQYAPVAVVKLQTTIDSRTARTNDRIEAKLLTDWILGNKKVPAGSRLHGVVMNANPGSVTLEFTQYQVKQEPAAAVSVRILMASGAQYVTSPPMMLMNQNAEHTLDRVRVGNLAAANDAQDRTYERSVGSQYGIPPRSTLKNVVQVRTLRDGAARVTGKTGLRIPKGAWFWIVSSEPCPRVSQRNTGCPISRF